MGQEDREGRKQRHAAPASASVAARRDSAAAGRACSLPTAAAHVVAVVEGERREEGVRHDKSPDRPVGRG